jgi:hypothetical protein
MLDSMGRRRSEVWHQRALVIGAVTAALFSAHCGNAGQDSADPPPEDLAICHAPASASGSPATIEDVTALINALAEEHGGTVELPCFVASLNRPLGAATSSGFVSAQPAEGARSPRMFLWSGALVLSVVPEGIGGNLLELGFQTTPTRSIKAEIEFPVTAPLSLSAPYDRVLGEPLSKCAPCHANEEPATSVTWAKAFESEVLRPSDFHEVDLGEVEQESKACDKAVEPQRCALLGSIFDQGGIHAQAFAREARTLYGD